MRILNIEVEWKHRLVFLAKTDYGVSCQVIATPGARIPVLERVIGLAVRSGGAQICLMCKLPCSGLFSSFFFLEKKKERRKKKTPKIKGQNTHPTLKYDRQSKSLATVSYAPGMYTPFSCSLSPTT